jgi:ABC-type sulfate transport system permease component
MQSFWVFDEVQFIKLLMMMPHIQTGIFLSSFFWSHGPIGIFLCEWNIPFAHIETVVL